MAVRGFLSKISGKGQRQKTDDAIDAAMGSKKPPDVKKPSSAKPSPKPSAKSVGRSGGR